MKKHKLLILPYTAKALQAVIDCSEHRFCKDTKPERQNKPKWGTPLTPKMKGELCRKEIY